MQRSILQYTLQFKLVEQREEEGNADEMKDWLPILLVKGLIFKKYKV